jgi:NADH-quinone oxidoreductase subunit M
LPGLSGFVAEMTVFVGSWQVDDWFHRAATIAAIMSIVVTAVYILRAIGSTAMGPIKNPSFATLKDATWNEKLAAVILLIGIIGIGIAPSWLSNLLKPAAEIITNRIMGK